MPHYKAGKQTELLTFQQIQEKISRAKLTLEAAAFFWVLYWAGCRKSEAYERILEDVKITETFLILDFHQRKKHGAAVPALKFPLEFPGVKTIAAQFNAMTKTHSSRKLIERTVKGIRSTEYRRAHWLFPRIQKQWAIHIIKQILGENYYPHFLRLNRLTEIASNPGANLTMLKSYSGIKSTRALEAYLGTSEKEQDAAIDFLGKKIRGNQAGQPERS